MSQLSFPEHYDELAVLAHHGATEAELARRAAEREPMDQVERFRADQLARTHQGPTLADHRARWAAETETEVEPAPPASAYPPGAEPPEVPAGTAADVLDWVGADPHRARAALDAEADHARPRAGLAAALRKIAGG